MNRPPLRPAARLYVAALVGLALGLARLEPAVPLLPPGDRLLAALLGGAIAVASLFPLHFAFRTKYSADTAVVIAAALLFDRGTAMLVVAGGTLLAHALRPTARDPAQALVNGALVALQAAAGSLVLAAVGWDPADPSFGRPAALLGVVGAAAAIHLANVVGVATMVSLQEALPVVRSWGPALREDLRAELLAQLSLLAIGLLGAMVADARPWALLLLAVPVAGTHLALEHHVRLRRETEAARLSSDAGLAEAQRIARLGSWQWDLGAAEQVWSDETYRIFGFVPRSFVPTPDDFLGLVHDDDRPRVEAAIRRAAAEGTPFSLEHRALLADGSDRTVHQRGEVVTVAAAGPRRLVGTVHDVTERKALEGLLAHRALHDPLTDLPNRALFGERLAEALAGGAGGDLPVAVLFIDLDGFKTVNDSLGHEAGDRLLVAVAERLRSALVTDGPVGSTVARFGGDEFAVLIEGAAELGAVTRLAERLLGALGQVAFAGHEAFVTASIGVATGRPRRADPLDLLRAADIALYRAKAAGRGTHAVYEPAMDAPVVARLERETALRRALDDGELRLRYQPVVELATGRILGAEALARWDRPGHGLLPSEDFIRLAEETGLIVPLGRWALGEACRQGRSWPAAAPLVGVNLSARQFQDPGLLADIGGALDEAGFDPRCLEVEVTESVAMRDIAVTQRILAALRDLGVRVAIDDFGTGYSSLGRLRELAPDALKLDRSFVADLGRDGESRAVVRAVAGLARDLDLTVTAEGVETAEQAGRLRELGIDRAQGFYFAPPLTGPAVAELLARAARLPGPVAAPVAAAVG